MFPKDFVWGAATAAYQVEGGCDSDGKGLSVWDVFTERCGAIKDGSDGRIACNHYGLYREDVRLMKELGLKAYRFSVSWPRVFPDGVSLNGRGIDFYDRLTDELLKNGIEPYLTLYHWDLPQALQMRGGWLNRDITEVFADYAYTVAKELGDRVKYFITFNEPQVFLNAGYVTGSHAPGWQIGLREELAAVHNVLLAHGKGVAAICAAASGAKVGWASAGYPGYPLTDTPENREAAEEVTFTYPDEHPCTAVAVFADPIVFGDYGRAYYEKYASFLPDMGKDDLKIISAPIDFYGQNCYAGRAVYMGKNGPVVCKARVGEALTQMQWNIAPECLYWFPKMLFERYGLPVYITENGVSCTDFVFTDKKVHDVYRIEYMRTHLAALRRAASEADVRGYFAWSLMDNFEWSEGYTQRFGLVYVDFETLERTPKDSFEYYRRVIATGGEDL